MIDTKNNFGQRLSDFCTIQYIRYFGKFLKKIIYDYNGMKNQVYIFSDNGKGRGGHMTPFRTILLNENIFNKYSVNVQNYVYLHEVGHKSMNVIIGLFFNILLIISILFLFSSIFFTLISPMAIIISTFIFGFQLISVLVQIFSAILLLLVSSIIFLIVSWIDEGYAELFAVNYLGIDNYVSAVNEIKNKRSKIKFFSRCFETLQYPPSKIIVKIYLFLKRGKVIKHF